MRMHLFFSWLSAILIGLFFSMAHAAASFSEFPKWTYKTGTQIIEFKDAYGEPVQVLASRYQNVPRSELPRIIDAATKNRKNDLLVSFSDDLSSEVLKAEGLKAKDNKSFLLPLKNNYQKIKEHLKSSVQSDPIGVIVVAINTSYDSFLWINADSLGVEQKSAMFLFNLLLAGSFGLNKDLWSQMTKPFERRICKLLSLLSPNSSTLKTITASFTANLAFGLALQGIRMSILSYPHLIEAASSLHFWGTTVSLSALMTMTSFGWSEQLAAVDEAKNPKAKALLRRFMEARALLLGHVAPAGKLMQPEVYGTTPIIATLIHGGLGLWMMLKSEKIIQWIESKTFFERLYQNHEKMHLWLSRQWRALSPTPQSLGISPLTCSILFAD